MIGKLSIKIFNQKIYKLFFLGWSQLSPSPPTSSPHNNCCQSISGHKCGRLHSNKQPSPSPSSLTLYRKCLSSPSWSYPSTPSSNFSLLGLSTRADATTFCGRRYATRVVFPPRSSCGSSCTASRRGCGKFTAISSTAATKV